MIQLIEENFNLHAIRIPASAGMKVFKQQHLSYVDCGLSCDTFNILHITDGAQLTKEELVAAVGYYRDRNLHFCIWINQENLNTSVRKFLQELALSVQNEETGMVLELKDYVPVTNEQFVNITVVQTEQQLAAYANTISQNWSPPDQNIITYYHQTRNQFLNRDNAVTLLIYQEKDRVVATLELFATDKNTIGLYGLITLPECRGKGIGSALMMYALNLSKQQGYERLILQATTDGIGIYTRLGFKPYTNYLEFS